MSALLRRTCAVRQSEKEQLARQELIYSSIDQLKINGKKKREERKCDKEIE